MAWSVGTEAGALFVARRVSRGWLRDSKKCGLNNSVRAANAL